MTPLSRLRTLLPISGCTNLDIINAQLPGYEDLHWLRIDQQGAIAVIQPMKTEKPPLPSVENLQDIALLDVEGDWVSLGGVDLQINGALGLAFPDLELADFDKLKDICQFLWHEGVDIFLPTLVTTSVENIQRSLATLSSFIKNPDYSCPENQRTAKIGGVHLEGPFLNPDKRGAHPGEYLLPLTLDNVKRVLGDYAQLVKIITLAPELDPSGETLDYLHSLGITISLGHSLATAEQATAAFNRGASMVTHAFNAMPPIHHRQPGLLGAAIVHPEVKCGLIADGEHISPITIELLLRASHYYKGIFLVSDALSPLGLPDGKYPWDSRQIEVINGTARLEDGTLAGTTLPLLTGVQNLVKWGLCEVGDAIALATKSPRWAIGLPQLNIGQPASLLRWHLDESENLLTWERLGPLD